MTRQAHSRPTAEWIQGGLASDEDLLARVLELGLQALMEAERDAHVEAEPFERTGARRTQRNGYKPRTLRTRVGSLELRVPQTRNGRFYPSLLERYQRSEGALIAASADPVSSPPRSRARRATNPRDQSIGRPGEVFSHHSGLGGSPLRGTQIATLYRGFRPQRPTDGKYTPSRPTTPGTPALDRVA